MTSALLSVKELSELLKVSEATIYYWKGVGKIPYIKAGRHLRFDWDDVLKAFEGSKSCPGGGNLLEPPVGRSLKSYEMNLVPSQKGGNNGS